MTTTQNTAAQIATMITSKVRQAQANGATEEQAIRAVRALWLEHLRSEIAKEA